MGPRDDPWTPLRLRRASGVVRPRPGVRGGRGEPQVAVLRRDGLSSDLFERTAATACLDTGHAHVSGCSLAEQADLLREHGERISHVHLNDTRIDETDEHLPVGVGRLDFAALADEPRAFGKRRFDRLLAD